MQSPNSEVLKNTVGNRTKSPLSWNKQAARILKSLAEAISPARRVDQRGKIRRPYVSETFEIRTLLATTVWNGSSGGSWFNSSKWAGGVPNSSTDVEIMSTNAGVLTFEGGKAEAASLFVGAHKWPGRVDFDLDGGRLTVDNASIGGPASASSLGLPARLAPFYNTFGSAYVRNGQLTVDENASVGQRGAGSPLVGPSASGSQSEGRLFVGTGGKVDVGKGLLLGSDKISLGPQHSYIGVGYVHVMAGGQLTTDRVVGWNRSKAYVYGYGAKWLNTGDFAADASLGAGGYLETERFTGALELNGGSLFTREHSPSKQTLSEGHLIVSAGNYRPIDTSVPNGAALTVENGTSGNGLGTLSVGGESIFNWGIVRVESGSTMNWSSINLMRSGQLRITGSQSRVTSTQQAGPTPQVIVQGFNSHLSLNDGGQISGREFLIQGSGSASVSGTGSRLAASHSVRIGGTSTLFPQDNGSSFLSVGTGSTALSLGTVTISSGGELRLFGGTVSTPNVKLDRGGLVGGGQITGSVEILSGGQINPGTQTLRTNSVLFQNGSRFIASLNGRTAGTQYSQLDVTGAANLNGARLEVSETFTSAPGDEFLIIRNDGTDPVLGTFAGLNEGSVAVIAGVSYTITYQGGDGNDVVLTSNGNLPVIVTPTTATSNNQPEFRWLSVPSAATYTLQVHSVTTGQQNLINLSGISTASHQITSTLPLGTYEAYVQAFDASGVASLRSPKRSFTVLPPFSPNVFPDSVDVNIGNGQALDSAGKVSLRAAVQESNALAGTDKISLGAGTFTLSRSGIGEEIAATGDLDITDDLIIEGAGANLTIINANSADRVFHVRPGGKLTLKNVTITGGRLTDYGEYNSGGGIQNNGTLTLIDCKMTGNSAIEGGALSNFRVSVSASAVANVINTVITGNSAGSRGGAIATYSSSETSKSIVTLQGVTISSNTSVSNGGGGIYVAPGGDLDVTDSLFESNNATNGGGAIYSENHTGKATVRLRNSEFRNNAASGGGAIFVYGAAGYGGSTFLSIEGSLFSMNRTNSTYGSGGAILIRQLEAESSVLIQSSQFLDNEATSQGGAIWAERFGTLRIIGSEFRRNQANRGGGAVIALQGSHLQITDSTFAANEVKLEGGTGAVGAGEVNNVEITGSTFSGNIAQTGAGAVSLGSTLLADTTYRITNSTFSGNRAVTGDGGAIGIGGNLSQTTILSNVTITGNHAGGKGGGIVNPSPIWISKPAQLQNTLVAGNTATTSQPDVSGAFESLGHNLIGNIGATSGSGHATGFGATGDLIGGNGQPVINPLLGPLQDNGGPTFTHALLDGSPAIDAGVAVEGVLVDQSSANRQQGRAPEIGALERPVDLKLTGFRSNGLLTVFVDYEIIGITPSSVKVSFYLTSAAHRQESDTLLKSFVLTSASDLTPGLHTKQFTVGSGASNLPLPGVGAADLGENYFILAEIDSDDVTGEIDDRASESNNTALFGGTYHAPGQAVYVHGSPGSDNLSITVGSVRVGINGQNYTYQNSDVTNVILRSHSGNDVIRQEAVTAGVIITGGRGDNEVLWDKLGSVIALNSLIQAGTSGIAVIDLTGTNSNDLRLDYSSASAVVGNTKELRILGGSGDQVRIGSGWLKVGTASVFGLTYDKYEQEEVTLLIQRQLDVMSLSVDSDGKLTVNGTNSNNVIQVSQFTPSGQSEKVQVVVDGVSHRFEAADVTALIVNGKNGNDTVTLSTAVRIAATLNGGNGNDILTGGRGNDLLIGGPGDDTYVFGLASTAEADQVTENLNEGTDTLSFASLSTSVVVNLATTSIQPVHTNRTLKLNSAVVFENLIGGAGADTLFGNNLNNTLAGGAGDDKLIGATGNDLLLGGANNDTYVFLPTSVAEADQVTENANEGIDTLNFAYLTTSVVVNLASTSIQTVHTSRTLKLNSETVLEDIVAGSGADTLFGNSLNNTLSGNAGNDKLLGAGGNDLLYGGADNDTYMFVPTTVAEADTVSENLNQGIDTLNFGYLTTSVVVNLGSTSVQPVHTNRTLKLNSAVVFENLDGGSGADTLFGNTLNNTLTGNAGDDKLLGAAGNDSLLGGANNDTYMFVPTSVAEADTVTENANEGVDTLNFAYLTTSVVLNLGSTSIQTVHLNRTLKLNSLSTFENAVGGTGSDTLLGNAVANRLTGGLGDNILVGMEGGDILEAGSGRDILIGGLGLDILKGDAGDDIVIAGRTTSDTSLSNLNTLRTQWISGNAYATRITNLRAGVGNPVVSMKAKTNVLNDAGEDDVLFGGTGTDWFFRALDDVITDLVAGEILDLL